MGHLSLPKKGGREGRTYPKGEGEQGDACGRKIYNNSEFKVWRVYGK